MTRRRGIAELLLFLGASGIAGQADEPDPGQVAPP